MIDFVGGLVVGALTAFFILWFYFWVWKPMKKWREIMYNEAALVLARLQDAGLHQRVAELLMLSFWRAEPHKLIKDLLELYADRKMEEVYKSYGLPTS